MATEISVGALAGIFAVFGIIFLIIGLALYVYLSLAFTSIARKAKLSAPGLAWIPGIGILLTIFRASRMHWWPWLLLIGVFIPFTIVRSLSAITFLVFTLIWYWKMFQNINKPGWWVFLMLIPIVNLIMIGVAAWSKSEQVSPTPEAEPPTPPLIF
tara:strand:+ start:131 stop:598 length:468 start_codon:yes stop_codon:yes gene_type:complete